MTCQKYYNLKIVYHKQWQIAKAAVHLIESWLKWIRLSWKSTLSTPNHSTNAKFTGLNTSQMRNYPISSVD